MYKAILLSTAVAALSAPTAIQLEEKQSASFEQHLSAWDTGANNHYPIHSSCDATHRAHIAAVLNETILLAQHAKDHVTRWGNSSVLYQRYFWELPPYEVIGAFDIIVSGDKGGVLFRCDNPDGNCANEGWAGHWRGSNATDDTVICDLSYERRRWLSSMCGQGYTVATVSHACIGYGYVEHYIETYEDALAFAANGTITNTHDSDVLQYFTLDAYAYDIAIPGTGCTGETNPDSEVEAAPVSSAAASTRSASVSVSTAASQTSSASAECHTHADGVIHWT